jgi:hypothetical protein
MADIESQNSLSMTNFLFTDGRAAPMKPTATGTPINMWNGDNITVSDGVNSTLAPALHLTRLAQQRPAIK